MRVNLVTDPAVKAMARALKIDAFSVVGRLHSLWSWADEHTDNGEIPWITFDDLDDMIGKRGFAAQMAAVGWLQDCGEAIRFPNFERHNGDSAKRRVMETERKRRQRGPENDGTQCPASVPQNLGQKRDTVPEKAGPEKRREEKRREEGIPTEEPAKSDLQRRAEKLHGKRESTPWDKSELAAWKTAQAVVAATTEDEWTLLEAFYAAPQDKTYARKSLATTLNNWAGEISRAREWAKRNQAGWQPPAGDF